MANWEYEIKATGYKHDMAPWLNEKASTLIDSLGRVAETLLKDKTLSADPRYYHPAREERKEYRQNTGNSFARLRHL